MQSLRVVAQKDRRFQIIDNLSGCQLPAVFMDRNFNTGEFQVRNALYRLIKREVFKALGCRSN